MANAQGHGGYREPSKPAAASGPGRYAKRTDGGPVQKLRKMTGGDYGDGQDMASLQRSAPMGGTAPATSAQAGPLPIDGSQLTGLDAPTAQPGVGVLDNLAGPAPAPTALDDQTRARMQSYLPFLLWMGSQPQASEATRQFVRQLRSDL